MPLLSILDNLLGGVLGLLGLAPAPAVPTATPAQVTQEISSATHAAVTASDQAAAAALALPAAQATALNSQISFKLGGALISSIAGLGGSLYSAMHGYENAASLGADGGMAYLSSLNTAGTAAGYASGLASAGIQTGNMLAQFALDLPAAVAASL